MFSYVYITICSCHPERSEGSISPGTEILRCAQDDRTGSGCSRSFIASPCLKAGSYFLTTT
jgi:hypothetical protein